MTNNVIPMKRSEHLIPDHEFRGLVNDLRAIADKYHDYGCLREMIRKRLSDALKRERIDGEKKISTP